MSVRILLADDHAIVRDGIRLLLDREPDMEVVGEADNGHAAIDKAVALSPDIVIMDVSMPDLNGIEATRQITAKSTDTKIIALSMHKMKKLVTGMLASGANAYLLKNCVGEELIRAIREVMDGRLYVSAELTHMVLEDYQHRLAMDETSVKPELSSREREILQLLAEGHRSLEIAERLHLSVKTIKTHRQHLMDKLQLHNIADLTRYAIAEGLVSSDM